MRVKWVKKVAKEQAEAAKAGSKANTEAATDDEDDVVKKNGKSGGKVKRVTVPAVERRRLPPEQCRARVRAKKAEMDGEG